MSLRLLEHVPQHPHYWNKQTENVWLLSLSGLDAVHVVRNDMFRRPRDTVCVVRFRGFGISMQETAVTKLVRIKLLLELSLLLHQLEGGCWYDKTNARNFKEPFISLRGVDEVIWWWSMFKQPSHKILLLKMSNFKLLCVWICLFRPITLFLWILPRLC